MVTAIVFANLNNLQYFFTQTAIVFADTNRHRFCRSERALNLALAEMYVAGVATRKVSKIIETMCGFEVSSSHVFIILGVRLFVMLRRNRDFNWT
jgi:hypothetical protein